MIYTKGPKTPSSSKRIEQFVLLFREVPAFDVSRSLSAPRLTSLYPHPYIHC